MDAGRFDRLTRSFAASFSRRRVLAGLAGAGVATGPAREAGDARKRKRKVKRNAFGCVDVGSFCKNAGHCCSGICRGKKGKKSCRAHDAQGCRVEDDSCAFGNTPCLTSAGVGGFCHRTTGNAGYCALDADCFACTKDEECVPFCGEGAACIVCADQPCPGIAGRECAGPGPDPCTIS